MKRVGRSVPILTLLLIGGVVLLYYVQLPLLEGFEARTYDLRMRARQGMKKPAGTIAIIAIDDKSIAELGRFPWSREHFSALIETASAAGARGLVFDVLFPEPQSSAIDRALAAAIKASGRTTLAEAFTLAPDGGTTTPLQPLPGLRAAARNLAHINVFPDDDGVLRWTRLVLPHSDGLHPSLALAASMAALGSDSFTAQPYGLSVGEHTVPTDGEHYLLINYRGPAGTFARFSFVDVLKGRVPPESLRGKVLLVGPTAIGIYDMRIAPVSSNMPGVEVNANIADNILAGDFMHHGGLEALGDLVAIILLGLLVALVASLLRAAAAFPLVVVITGVWLWLNLLLFDAGHWVSIVYPCLVIVLVYSAVSYLRFILLDRKSRQVRAMFSSYVSPKIVDQLVKNPELAKVGGESRIVTILFADVKNYTGYSEKRTPREVVTTLNEYLAEMTHSIIDHDGTLDKFMGDGILAYWGAPLPQDNHAELAVSCALDMLARLRQLHLKWQEEGTEPIACGIGLHTGEVIAGNLGAAGKKMEYTVIGDAVNLTFRIQNESRTANCPVMTEALYERVRQLVIADPLGPVLVKGKQLPIEIYALKGLRSAPSGNQQPDRRLSVPAPAATLPTRSSP